MSSAGGRVAREEAGWRYSAKDCEDWPGLRLCLQVIPRIFHGCALFLAVQCTTEGQSNLQKGPSHGVFLPEDMEETGETVFDTESIFLRILMVGQQRHLQLAPSFSYQYYCVQYLQLWLMSSGVCGGATRRL